VIGIVAGMTCAVILGGSAWLLGLLGPARHNAAPHPSSVASQQPDPSKNTTVSETPVRPSRGSDRDQGPGTVGDRNGGSHGTGPIPDIPGRQPGGDGSSPASHDVSSLLSLRVVHLADWLPKLLSKQQSSEEWVEILDSDFPEFPTVKLLVSKGLGIVAVPPTPPAGKSRVDVRLTKDENGQGASISVKGRKLRVQRQSKSGDELLARLQFCVLLIDSEDPIGSGHERPVRVVLTPVLPAVPLSGSEIEPFKSAGATAFFGVAQSYREILHARVRVDRVSLTILPRENTGWRLNIPAKDFHEKLDWPLEIDWRDGKWPAKFKLLMSPAEETDHPAAIRAQLDPSSAPKQNVGANAKEDEDKPARPPSAAATTAKKGSPKSKAGKKKSAPTGFFPEADSSNEDENSTVGLTKAGDGALLYELFRRYGRVHGSIVISVRNGERDEDVDVLKLDDVPQNVAP